MYTPRLVLCLANLLLILGLSFSVQRPLADLFAFISLFFPLMGI